MPRHLPKSRFHWVVVVLLVSLFTAACTANGQEPAAEDLLGQVVTAEIDDRSHVEGAVDYDRVPPLGGPHAPVWANCGFYLGQVVPPELAVHSMEHGAVWIAYPDGGDVDTERLREFTVGQPDVLVAPSTAVSGVVATAWGAQLEVGSADDPALAAFIESYVRGPNTPEPGAPCSGGVGEPS